MIQVDTIILPFLAFNKWDIQ